MRRLIPFLAMTISLIATTLMMAGSHDSVQAQLDINNDSLVAYLPFIHAAVPPLVSLSNITPTPTSPVTIPSNQDQHIDVAVTVSTNYRGALVVTLYRNDVPRDSACEMVDVPGPTTVSLPLDVALNGAPGTKDFTIDVRFKPGAIDCGGVGLFADVVKTKPYQITWEYEGCNTPPFTQLLRNGSFEDWPPIDLNGSIQQPQHWTINWVRPGQPLYDDDILSIADPEFTHKLESQLPQIEQRCQPEALILDGNKVYKIFRDGAWAGELWQTVSGLTAGQRVKLTVPIWQDSRIDDGYEAATVVSIDGVSTGWVWNFEVPQRKWTRHILETTVPGSGQLTVLIRMKSRYAGADFFIDAIRLEPLP